MGRYNSNTVSSTFIKNYLKNRLWEKDTFEYVPLLSVRSISSKGKSNRVKGWKTGRVHHFLSKLELTTFYYFDWSNDVLDIKEQYPLLPLELLQQISNEAGIEYPSFNGSPIIMTTDFFITVKRNGKLINYARTVKPSADLSNNRILEKFEIERRFFASRKIDWGIITEKELSNVFSNNMDILHSNTLISEDTILGKQHLYMMYEQLADRIIKNINRDIPLCYILSELSKNLNLNLANINKIFFKAIADKILVLDIFNKPLDTNILVTNDLNVNTDILLHMADTV